MSSIVLFVVLGIFVVSSILFVLLFVKKQAEYNKINLRFKDVAARVGWAFAMPISLLASE